MAKSPQVMTSPLVFASIVHKHIFAVKKSRSLSQANRLTTRAGEAT